MKSRSWLLILLAIIAGGLAVMKAIHFIKMLVEGQS